MARGAEPSRSSASASQPNAACRVYNTAPDGAASVGSGTLIHVQPDRTRGLVLTCAHLFREGAGRVVVEFPGRGRHGAVLAAIDPAADLAALEITTPPPSPVEIQLGPIASPALRACGFGGDGAYRCASGPVLGYAAGPGQQSLRLAGAVRPGDSGGGVFDEQGRLCAVVWGAADGVTYASTGGPLRRFLHGLLGSNGSAAIAAQPIARGGACIAGRCPLVPAGPSGGAPAGRSPAAGGGQDFGASGGGLLPWRPLNPGKACDCGDELAAIAARLDDLEQRRPGGAGAIDPGAGGSWSRAARAAAVLATTALGVSGPAGWAVIAGATLGGWLLGRRLQKARRRRPAPPVAASTPPDLQPTAHSSQPAAQDSPPTAHRPKLTAQSPQPTASQEATAAADDPFPPDETLALRAAVRQPIERDDREARQLLRLSQLEGRDPLQDALAGRLALDRLDAIADGDADPHRVRWADDLRRELRDRFNEVAPTRFQMAE